MDGVDPTTAKHDVFPMGTVDASMIITGSDIDMLDAGMDPVASRLKLNPPLEDTLVGKNGFI